MSLQYILTPLRIVHSAFETATFSRDEIQAWFGTRDVLEIRLKTDHQETLLEYEEKSLQLLTEVQNRKDYPDTKREDSLAPLDIKYCVITDAYRESIIVSSSAGEGNQSLQYNSSRTYSKMGRGQPLSRQSFALLQARKPPNNIYQCCVKTTTKVGVGE